MTKIKKTDFGVAFLKRKSTIGTDVNNLHMIQNIERSKKSKIERIERIERWRMIGIFIWTMIFLFTGVFIGYAIGSYLEMQKREEPRTKELKS